MLAMENHESKKSTVQCLQTELTQKHIQMQILMVFHAFCCFLHRFSYIYQPFALAIFFSIAGHGKLQTQEVPCSVFTHKQIEIQIWLVSDAFCLFSHWFSCIFSFCSSITFF